jgi:hypothetical protein
MAVERRNPLPAGRYWIHLDSSDAPSFDAWRRQPSVFTRTTTYHPDDGWTWYLFDVKAPIAWQAELWGWPTIADAHVTTETDVIQLPDPPPDWTDRIENAVKSAGTSTLVTIGVVAIGAVVVSRLLK